MRKKLMWTEKMVNTATRWSLKKGNHPCPPKSLRKRTKTSRFKKKENSLLITSIDIRMMRLHFTIKTIKVEIANLGFLGLAEVL